MSQTYLYISADLRQAGRFEHDALGDTLERHKIPIDVPPLTAASDPLAGVDGQVHGVVFGLERGFLDRAQLGAVQRAMNRGLDVWAYWPAERVVERVDRDRLASYRHQWLALNLIQRTVLPASRIPRRLKRVRPALRWIYRGEFPVRRLEILGRLDTAILDAKPEPFVWPADGRMPSGLYLRTDFWNEISSGGSYGHTCYVAKELAATTGRFVALTPRRYTLLDQLGVHQVVMELPRRLEGDDAVVMAPRHYYNIVKTACEIVRPSYIYERICVGNEIGALLSHELHIPYIVEYNGSELSMTRSFGGPEPQYADVFLAAEEFAFRQASVISVVSDAVRDDLVKRGVDRRKILVNPNGADLDAYAPPAQEEKLAVRKELGLASTSCVVGFTGTFGGWHGVDVLAAAIPRICRRAPNVEFLLIGDGQHKALVDAQVAAEHLEDRVTCTGRVPQAEGARLMKACDVYVSPHSSHMVDSRFFGSPTKVFEYMAMGGAIVASDLEQIGQVLSPAMRPDDLADPRCTVVDQRSVLCQPGNVDQFVDAVVGLASRSDLVDPLGRNARAAVERDYSWAAHVARLWEFARPAGRGRAAAIVTGDSYKDETQSQWNNNPIGTQHARVTQPHTLEWFQEIEAHRYGVYAPWMPEVMEFAAHRGEDLLEVGGGIGTDLAQFARHGARTTDLDLSVGHLEHAQENFRLRGLEGRFVHHDAESLPFPDNSFDVVYSNGVLHHTPNTAQAIAEIFRVLRPGGKVIAMFYAENSLHYWRNLFWFLGVHEGMLTTQSIGEIMSRSVERTATDARPLVKVYTRRRLRGMFDRFADVRIVQRQMVPEELPRWLVPLRPWIERVAGWNLIIKGTKPRR